MASAEIFDPSTNVGTLIDPMLEEHSGHSVVMLADGRVLVAGGIKLTTEGMVPVSAELYDPATAEWNHTGLMSRRTYAHALTLLADGRALMSGGFGAGSGVSAADIYDPATDTWTSVGEMKEDRMLHTTTLLLDGRVLAVGGTNRRGNIALAEIYDPSTGVWSPAGEMSRSRTSHTASLLKDGKVLVVGGDGITVEIYDPTTGSWSFSGP
jgi:N-acetylneuraminic acid mutarotase